MNEDIVKICKRHGELKIEDVRGYGGKYYLQCKKCTYDRQVENRKNNKEKIKNESRKWKIKNSELNKEHMRRGGRKRVKEIRKSYVRERLVNIGFPRELITDELIEVKKILLIIKRIIKERRKVNEEVKAG